MNFSRFKIAILLLSLLGVLTAYSMNTPSVKLKTFLYRYPSLRDVIDLGTSAIFWPVGIALNLHELSHALTANVLDQSPIDMHIGIGPSTASNPLFKTAGLTIESFDILQGGYAQLTSVSTTKAKEIAILAAGPLGGILSLLLCKKITDKIEDPCIREVYKACINENSIHQLLYGFTPILDPGGGTGDGYRIWTTLGLPTQGAMLFTKPAKNIFLAWAMAYVVPYDKTEFF